MYSCYYQYSTELGVQLRSKRFELLSSCVNHSFNVTSQASLSLSTTHKSHSRTGTVAEPVGCTLPVLVDMANLASSAPPGSGIVFFDFLIFWSQWPRLRANLSYEYEYKQQFFHAGFGGRPVIKPPRNALQCQGATDKLATALARGDRGGCGFFRPGPHGCISYWRFGWQIDLSALWPKIQTRL